MGQEANESEVDRRQRRQRVTETWGRGKIGRVEGGREGEREEAGGGKGGEGGGWGGGAPRAPVGEQLRYRGAHQLVLRAIRDCQLDKPEEETIKRHADGWPSSVGGSGELGWEMRKLSFALAGWRRRMERKDGMIDKQGRYAGRGGRVDCKSRLEVKEGGGKKEGESVGRVGLLNGQEWEGIRGNRLGEGAF